MANGSCIGCLCHSCANNIDNLLTDGNECKNPCFHCDDCMTKEGLAMPMNKCNDHKITNIQAERQRKHLKIVKE